ncbi:MAG: hypothetical protein NTW22_08135 [Proteobacteria bacterium]|nr:hypothetical protein [Pseudomonadota bacterium]
MLKFGIHNKSQIRKKVKLVSFFGGEKKISITLYDQIISESNADELAERILFLFADERGAYKRTYQKRFEDFDQIVLRYLKENFKNEMPLTLHDVAVSDGRTALDFFEKISSDFTKVEYVASDYNPKIYVIQEGKCKVTVSCTGKILEILFPPFVFNVIKRDSIRHYPLNHLIKSVVERLIAIPLVKKYQSGMIHAKELLLFAPRVLNAAQNDSRLTLQQHNLLEPFDKPVHIIRAMNILNPSYFSETEFLKVLNHVHKGLKDHGVFITGSNEEAGSIVNGGIYKKNINGFEKIYESGVGSPINQFIMNFNK